MAKHAKLRPPSAAARWLSCTASVDIVPLYPNGSNQYSEKGDYVHEILEDCLVFGVTPHTGDTDTDEAVEGVLEYLAGLMHHYGPKAMLYPEQWLDIPETGEGGTADVVIDAPDALHVCDYKNGWVIVEVKMNAQMMNYLLGAIAKYGERDKYYITVLQPNGSHIDGPYRSYEVSQADVDWFRREVAFAMDPDNKKFSAGKHCKKTYCAHRGACATFAAWALDNGPNAYFTSELNSYSEETLAQLLDHAETLAGWRDELRSEAMRRLLHMDRKVPGYKIVKGSKDRKFKDEAEVIATLNELECPDSVMYTKKFTTVKGVEDFIKAKFKSLGRGKWKDMWNDLIAPHVLEATRGLTLERATDARPAHKRGSEFSELRPEVVEGTEAQKDIII